MAGGLGSVHRTDVVVYQCRLESDCLHSSPDSASCLSDTEQFSLSVLVSSSLK